MLVRRRLQGLLCVTAGVLLGPLAFAQTPVQRLSHVPASGEARIPLRGTEGPHAARAQQLGALAEATELTSMSLVLKPTAAQDAALTQLLADQQNPASDNYQHWLTPAQFGDRFGAAQADIDLVESWLQSNGFVVQGVPASRNRILFSGTAASAERAFRTSLQRYSRDGREFFENQDAVQLPQSLASIVSDVTGLSSFRPMAPQVRRAAQVTASPAYTTSTGSHYIVPDDLRTIYGTNTLIGSGYNGSGITIGIIGQSAVDTQQLTYFQQKTGQTLNLPTMVLVPRTGASNKVSGDEGESELDLEYAGGNAPGASIQFIYTGCTNTTSSSTLPSSTSCGNGGVFDALVYAITNTSNLPTILSLSYGGCEASDASYAQQTLEPMLRQANAQGQTIMVSSGDSGAAGCETNSAAKAATTGLAVSYPASSPYVTAVGGTQLTGDTSAYWSNTNNSYLGSALGYVPETSWNDSVAYGALASSGGGVSQIFAKPSWQVGTGVPADSHRDVPDVAFPANVTEHAYLTCDANGPCTSGNKSFTLSGTQRDGGGVGGTSAAAPTFAGMLAVVEQANGGKALGNINPSLYALAQNTSKAAVFHDITTGSNIVACTVGTPNCTTGTLGYSAGIGYDLVTGLGSLNIPSLRTALAGYAAGVPRVQLAVVATAAAGAPVTFTATVSGSGSTPTGSATFSVDGAVVGSSVTLSAGTAAYGYSGFTSGGTHTVSVAYSGDSTYSAATASTTVTATAVTPTLTLTAAPTSAAINAAVMLTAALTSSSGAPSGTIVFGVDGTTVSTNTVANGTATYTFSGFASAGIHTVTALYTPSTSGSAAVFNSVQSTLSVVSYGPGQTLTPTLQVMLSPATVAGGATLTAAVQVAGSGSTPTGTVGFSIDGGSVSAVPLVNGAASLGLTAPSAIGPHTLQVSYQGDSSYRAAISTSSFAVAPPSTSVTVAPTALTAAYGTSVNGSLTVTSMGAAGATSIKLQLLSSTGAAFRGCYDLNPKSLVLPANGSVTATLILYTTAASCNAPAMRPVLPAADSLQANSAGGQKLVWVLLPLPLLVSLLRRRGRVSGGLMAAGLMCCISFSGCGSGSSVGTSTTGGSGSTGTTTVTSSNAGSYVIQVTALTPSGGTTLSSTTNFTLNVQ